MRKQGRKLRPTWSWPLLAPAPVAHPAEDVSALENRGAEYYTFEARDDVPEPT